MRVQFTFTSGLEENKVNKMLETPISDWNVVVAILFGLTIGIPAVVVGCIKTEIYIINKIKKHRNDQGQ